MFQLLSMTVAYLNPLANNVLSISPPVQMLLKLLNGILREIITGWGRGGFLL